MRRRADRDKRAQATDRGEEWERKALAELLDGMTPTPDEEDAPPS